MAYRAGFDRRWPAGGVYFAEPFASRARAPVFRDSVSTASLSTGDESDGRLSNTEYLISTGLWRVVSTPALIGSQAIECKGNGCVHANDPNPVGTWCFTVRPSGISRFHFFSDLKTSSANNSYFLQINGPIGELRLRRNTSGASTTKWNTGTYYLVPDSTYCFCITRSAGGSLTTYVNGPGFACWTLVVPDAGTNPVVDLVHSNTRYIVADMVTGDLIGNVLHMQGVVSPI